ncbi:GNAT family N-acetyltransferase [Dyella choica]|uniref:GNAT family N-acetyltransferase n=1 Tax=Dyella choica TaxID=1927959 RepID=A0A3S0PI96_9GAMM|nr:GNAT family N-acetyltransferase [Dyella choica]RUL74943.1 GNAT family N-acetyltransferase [Dyella choica]
MGKPFTIRPVRPADFSGWLPLWQSYNAFYGRTGATALPAQITQSTWQRFFDAYEPVHALIAERDGRLLGLAHYLLHRSTIQLEPSCYLQDLFTEDSARGSGIGRALIEAVYQAASETGCRRVYWQTHESNAAAMLLYDQLAEKSGFIVYRKFL